MRRFVTLFVLLLCAVPFGVSISGCSHQTAPTFCNGGDSGIVVGQATTINLQPVVSGVSLNFAEIGQLSNPAATDCKGNAAFVGTYTYGTTDMTIADVDPATGRLCGGTWNRHSGGGIADYTVCNPTNKSGTAYVSASANGVTSNPIPIFVHPVVTSIVLGSPSINCATDPATNCSPAAYTYSTVSTTSGACPTSAAFPSNPQLANGCCSIAPAVVSPPSSSILPFNPNACYSSGQLVQLSARMYAGTGANQQNISCFGGHLQFTAEGAASTTSVSPVVNIDNQNSVATANQPGSVLLTSNVSNAASSAGYFSTCPPASITLTAPGTTTNPIVVNQNNQQPLVATAVDTKGVALTGLNLTYVSTAPSTIPAGSTITPALAGAASIFALCEPPFCNSAPYSQIGLQGNGKPVVSNSVNITSPGTNGTVLFMASTQSKYIVSQDFTRTGLSLPLLLPYTPNSMVITSDGGTIYMGSSTALMVVNAVASLSLTRTDIGSPGTVLAVSPDGTEIVISDPTRQVISLETSSGSLISSYGGVGTHAQFSPDNQTVYITAGNQILVYSSFTGWTSITPTSPAADVAVTQPSVGAYFAGPVTTARGYCSSTTVSGTSATNVFYPLADSQAAITDRIAATTNGQHILGATATSGPVLSDLRVQIPSGPCPATGGLTFTSSLSSTVLNQITASAITGIWPTPDSSIAFLTYTGSSGLVPAYAPANSGPGQVSYVKLSGTATAPLSGAVSSDNSTFYTGTAGDNLVHIINRGTLTDSGTIAPALTGTSGSVVPVDLLVQKPRKTT